MEQRRTGIFENGYFFIKKLYEAGGPLPKEYSLLYDTLDLLSDELKNERLTKEELKKIWDIFSDEFMDNTLQGQSLKKPFGYAGDFRIIDMIYSKSTYPKYKKWDNFYNDSWAAKAVRNRKDYFKNMISNRCNDRKPHRLLNVASGPSRDLFELFEEKGIDNLKIDCIESDPKAIEYAQELCWKHLQSISFKRSNIFKFNTEIKYDLIWSAGLFDYFNDEHFVKLLRKLISCTTKKYEIIIGNFAPENPSRSCMEILLDWHLYHRDEAKLINLAIEAGCSREQLYVGKEDEGVNLFLHISS